jgi:phosphatidylethanolamine/phosphatidyl-N-methylethanolamine N-methyltransferase
VAQQESTRRPGPDSLRFLREFTRAPLTTAAIAPSSATLAEAMAAPVPEQGEPVVLELGPGTGSFTGVIQRKLHGRGRHVAVELNPEWTELLRSRHPAVEVVCADVATLPSVLEERGVSTVDCVVSGLPWAATGPDRSLTASVVDVLAPDGAFTQFAYTWAKWTRPARVRLEALRSHFEEVIVSSTVWRNAPPAAVYVARRPRLTPSSARRRVT